MTPSLEIHTCLAAARVPADTVQAEARWQPLVLEFWARLAERILDAGANSTPR